MDPAQQPLERAQDALQRRQHKRALDALREALDDAIRMYDHRALARIVELATTLESRTSGYDRTQSGIIRHKASDAQQTVPREPPASTEVAGSSARDELALGGSHPQVPGPTNRTPPDSPADGFGMLMAVVSALASIGAGIYLLSAKSVATFAGGSTSWFQILAHGIGVYFIAKGLFMGASLRQEIEQTKLLRSRN
jgi:hypothetical protein